ncbi:proteasome A-type and B-type family protein [Aphelenchoides avenae]|nr:proteasome A-type and B-type family protein [Aphelenchus avenae]
MDGKPIMNTLNPTCTGTSVVAISYDGGVALASDRVVSYGKSARYKHTTRQYRVNDRCIIAFGGDHADFQWLQNVVERQEANYRTYDLNAKHTPQAIHAYLTSLLYYRRCKMNPIWNILIVAGMQPEEHGDKLVPFIGVITPKGVAYTATSAATGLGAMTLNQAVQDNWRARDGKLTREEAYELLRKSMELSLYHDCMADNEYDLASVDATGVTLEKPETLTGNWQIGETNCQYE